MRAICTFLLLAISTIYAQGEPKALFYMTNSAASVQSFLNHADKIDILVPTWYSTDVHGLV